MKAVHVNQYGGPEVVEITKNAPEPSLKQGQILVKVHAASLNPFDVKFRLGMMKNSIPQSFPYIPGGDFAGVVTTLGQGVTEFKEGDEVFGSALILNGGSGSFAEIATANVKNTAHKPQSINFVEAASLPLVGSSAIQALEEHMKLQKSPTSAKASAGKQKILIHGGAGGIGSIAVQLAKHIGAYVATTVSSDDIAFVRSLGVDQVIDYKNEKFEEILSDFDCVFDTVGGKTTDDSFKVLKRGGTLVSMLGQPREELAKQYGVTAIGQSTNTNSEHLTRLAQLVDEGTIKPQIDKIFLLEEASEAFDYLENASPRGKVVLKFVEKPVYQG